MAHGVFLSPWIRWLYPSEEIGRPFFESVMRNTQYVSTPVQLYGPVLGMHRRLPRCRPEMNAADDFMLTNRTEYFFYEIFQSCIFGSSNGISSSPNGRF